MLQVMCSYWDIANQGGFSGSTRFVWVHVLTWISLRRPAANDERKMDMAAIW